jgi:hypothetical protein
MRSLINIFVGRVGVDQFVMCVFVCVATDIILGSFQL